MNSARILVVQPSAIDPPGILGEWLADAGADLDVVEGADAPGDLGGYDALVVLGGEMGALDDVQHPWLSVVRGLLSEAVRREIPVLAVCLGAQLLAVATGGQVRARRNGPEVGTLLVAKRDAAADDELLGEVPLTPDVLQFHHDEVTTLPPTAKLLASSPHSENQVFRVGNCAYAVQFHIETSTDTVLEWARLMPESAAFARPGTFDAAHLDEFHARMAETWQPLAERFVALAGTPPARRRTGRTLPLA